MLTILSLVSRELSQSYDDLHAAEKDYWRINNIPWDDRGPYFKLRNIDKNEGDIAYAQRRVRLNQRRISDATNEFLRRNGYRWDAAPRKINK